MNNPRCIRIFPNRNAVEKAVAVLKSAKITSYIKEDTFGDLTLEELNIRPRYRLYIDKSDIRKAGIFLAKKLREKNFED